MKTGSGNQCSEDVHAIWRRRQPVMNQFLHITNSCRSVPQSRDASQNPRDCKITKFGSLPRLRGNQWQAANHAALVPVPQPRRLVPEDTGKDLSLAPRSRFPPFSSSAVVEIRPSSFSSRPLPGSSQGPWDTTGTFQYRASQSG